MKSKILLILVSFIISFVAQARDITDNKSLNDYSKEGYKKCLNVRMIALLAPAIAPLAKSPKACWFPQMRSAK